MAYDIAFVTGAARELRGIRPEVRRRLRPRIDDLMNEPRPQGARRLRSRDLLYRIRVGDYRIVYSVDDDAQMVIVVRVRQRASAYRGLR